MASIVKLACLQTVACERYIDSCNSSAAFIAVLIFPVYIYGICIPSLFSFIAEYVVVAL